MPRPEHEQLSEDLRLTVWEAFVLRASGLLFGFVGRLLDLTLLLARPRLLPVYGALWWAELFRSPYHWPRSFEAVRQVKESGQSLRELMYGEAPVFSAVWLMWRAGVRRGARVLDLGAGRGRVLIAARWLGAHARGIELRPEHVRPVQPALARAGATLEVGDAMKAEWGEPTHVFLNWLAFADATRSQLVARLGALPSCPRVIAVGPEVTGGSFTRQSRHWVLMTWGPERATVHRRA